jgi:uncharacterized membrane protein YbhN (UPF0104 family)
MPTGGLVLFAGVTIVFVSFVCGAVNMIWMMQRTDNISELFHHGFRRHISAIIGMAAGMFVAFIGAALLAMRYLDK